MTAENTADKETDILPEPAPQKETETAPRHQKKSRRLPPLLRLTRRTVVFLSLTLIATILFFMTGNQQHFLDSNLNIILKIIACNAIALSFITFAAIFECIFYVAKIKKLRLIIHLICYILVLAVSVAVSILALSINMLSEGIFF
ncbi:hypothetical protein [uncultured Treponema sp.]|uniref:hypothetical protein n=1 Tax=uncultured Treponema sp. TaxID=162155 RepID=UPI0025DBF2C4|nr:hypothetical protein [uncultured Treponema sp.]